MPSAAAERKMAPRLVGLTTFSRSTRRSAVSKSDSGGGSRCRRIAHSIPRVRRNPVSFTSASDGAVYTGAVTLHAVKQGLGEEGEPVGEAAVEEVPVANAAALGGKTEAELSVGDSAKIGGKVLSMSLSGTTLTIHYT